METFNQIALALPRHRVPSDLDGQKLHSTILVVKICLIHPELQSAPDKNGRSGEKSRGNLLPKMLVLEGPQRSTDFSENWSENCHKDQ